MARTIYMKLAFDGTDFHGWQRQGTFRTVQLVLQAAVQRVVRHPVVLEGCGRTDAGVHAAGHVSHFITTCTMEPYRMRHAIGSRLDRDLSIVTLREVQPEFHARRSASSKLYRYRIHASTNRPVENMTDRYTHHIWRPLDVAAMQAGARHFVGEMDFASMASAGHGRVSTVRRVIRCEVEQHLDEVRIDVEGTGFMYRQVRNMTGTLVDVGVGRWKPDHVAEVLRSCDRTQAGPALPARGLTMQWVRYPQHLLRRPRGESTGENAPVDA